MSPRRSSNLIWLFTAGAAGSFVAVTQLATRDHLNIAQYISIALFAVVLPIFAAAVSALRASGHRAREVRRHAQRIGFVGGYLFVLGLGCLFWSLSTFIGLLFFGVIAVLIILRIRSSKLIKRGSLFRSLAARRRR
jgi:predicted lipid-binding transport protein (Tim44 family)